MPKDKLLLVGAGGFGRVVSELAVRDYVCAFVDDAFEVGAVVCGVSIVGHLSDLPSLFEKYGKLVVTIGNNAQRELIYQEAEHIGYGFPRLVHPSAYISPYAKIGDGCVLLQNVVVQNGATIGNGVLLNPGVEIHHDSFVDDNTLIYTNSVVRTCARVGRHVCIGSNVTICNNSVVVDESVIPDCTAVH